MATERAVTAGGEGPHAVVKTMLLNSRLLTAAILGSRGSWDTADLGPWRTYSKSRRSEEICCSPLSAMVELVETNIFMTMHLQYI